MRAQEDFSAGVEDSIEGMTQHHDTLYTQIDAITISHHLRHHFRLSQNTVTLTRDSRETAATFNDPSRALYRYSSTSTANDQANGIVYRGLPSHLTNWTIFGTEIVNPNHLSNAGTLSDQASQNAGGVLAVPFDVLDKFEFNPTPNPTHELSTASANLDMYPGGRSQSFLKLGLLGMEASYQSKKDNYVHIHGRYSTIGLLSDLGVDFGNEKIDFQDLYAAWKISDHWFAFSVLGSSNNSHSALSDSSEVAVIKDIQNIDYDAFLSVNGIRYFSERINHTMIFSFSDNNWKSKVDPAYSLFDYTDTVTRNKITKLAHRSEIVWGHSPKQGRWKGTMNTKWHKQDSEIYQSLYDDSYLDVQPSLGYHKLSGIYSLEVGLGTRYATDFKSVIPRFSINLKRIEAQTIVGIDFQSDAYRPDPLIINRRERISAEDSGLLSYIKGTSAAAYVKHETSQNSLALVRMFYMQFRNLPVNGDYSPFINQIDYMFDGQLRSIGQSRTYGMELMYDHRVSEQLYFHANFSLFEANYTTESDIRKAVENDFGYVFNTLFSYQTANAKSNIWSFNVASHLRGPTSTMHSFGGSQEEKKSYWRIDMKVSYSWKKSEWSLDIQNLFNRRNQGYIYYDALTERAERKDQLGMIPVMSYKRYL